jgi:CelD/BcsL family acetyltransferase involved in cellulose biosynthesis
MIDTEVIAETSGFLALAPEWRKLLHASSNNRFFLTWEWMYTWWLHLAGKRKLHIITVRKDGLLIAIAPLALCPPRISRLMPFRVLEFLASGGVGSDYLSFIIRTGYEEDAQRQLAASLAGSRRMLELVRIEKASHTMQDMATQFHKTGWRFSRQTTNYCPFARLSGHSWESYLGSLKPSHQKYYARKTRKLQRDFSVELNEVSTEVQRQEAMELFVRLHLESWAERGGSTALHKQELIDFHQALSGICLERGWLGLYTLKLDGVSAASIYLIKYGNVVHYYQMALHSDYSKYSIGLIILGESIRKAIEAGAVEYDFLHDNEAYKFLWAREQRELVRLELYPPQVLGRVYRRLMLTNYGAKRLVRNLNSLLQRH